MLRSTAEYQLTEIRTVFETATSEPRKQFFKTLLDAVQRIAASPELGDVQKTHVTEITTQRFLDCWTMLCRKSQTLRDAKDRDE